MKVKNVISSAEFNMIVSLTALVVIITLVVSRVLYHWDYLQVASTTGHTSTSKLLTDMSEEEVVRKIQSTGRSTYILS